MEWVSGMEWNHCPLSRGITVRIALEYSPTLYTPKPLSKKTSNYETALVYHLIVTIRNIEPQKEVPPTTQQSSMVVFYCKIITFSPAYGFL